MKIFGHRGASAHLAENTLPAFVRAVADGADGIELDVMPCASCEIIVCHDETLDRLAGRPEAPRRLRWEQLRTVKILDQAPIPLLVDVLEELGTKTQLNIELKTHPSALRRLIDHSLADEVAALLKAMGLQASCVVSSFDPLLLRRFAARAPEVETGLLLSAESSRPLREGWALAAMPRAAVHPQAPLVTPLRLARWHAQRRRVRVWTVDHPAELRWLAALGVDAVITNDPGAARAALIEKVATGLGGSPAAPGA